MVVCAEFMKSVNNSVDLTHNPEFTSIEIYTAPADYHNMFDLCTNLIKHTVLNIHPTGKLVFKGVELDFDKDFARIDFLDTLTTKLDLILILWIMMIQIRSKYYQIY